MTIKDIIWSWEKFKKENWWDSNAVDVEKVLTDKFSIICSQYVDTYIYTTKDIQEFAEWCSKNRWVYDIEKEYWTNRFDWNLPITQQRALYTSQLRDMWKIETGRRKG